MVRRPTGNVPIGSRGDTGVAEDVAESTGLG